VSPLSSPVQDLDWIITDFAGRVPSVAHAIVVSADGLKSRDHAILAESVGL